jgi:hypothetical protein
MASGRRGCEDRGPDNVASGKWQHGASFRPSRGARQLSPQAASTAPTGLAMSTSVMPTVRCPACGRYRGSPVGTSPTPGSGSDSTGGPTTRSSRTARLRTAQAPGSPRSTSPGGRCTPTTQFGGLRRRGRRSHHRVYQRGTASRNSAEWIAEAPGGSRGRFNLAQVANIEFAADKAWAGSTVHLAQTWPHHAIVMWNQYEDALPSGFNSSGTAFTAYWRNEY